MNIDHRGNVARCTERLDEPVGNILTDDIDAIRRRLLARGRQPAVCPMLDILPRFRREHADAAAAAAVPRVLAFRPTALVQRHNFILGLATSISPQITDQSQTTDPKLWL